MLSPGDISFSSSITFSSIQRYDALLRYPISEAPSLELGSSFLRSHIITEEFPWSFICFVNKSSHPNGWAEWVDHVFTTNKPFVVVLSQVGIAEAIKISPHLGRCGCFTEIAHVGDFDLSATVLERHIAEISMALKIAMAESVKHSRCVFPKGHFLKILLLPRKEKSMLKESMKYTYASSIRFFFGDFPTGERFETGPDHPQPLERAAFIAFWCTPPFGFVLLGLIPWPPSGDDSPPEYRVQVVLTGGALFPFAYRPDRVCRQFERQSLPPFDLTLFIPSGRVGRVLDEWIVYQRRLKASIIFFEGVKPVSPPHKILIMYKDPYYVTSIAIDQDKS
ncbi:hypothetical protein SESBI_36365, partial [Sesbania bispinosa]